MGQKKCVASIMAKNVPLYTFSNIFFVCSGFYNHTALPTELSKRFGIKIIHCSANCELSKKFGIKALLYQLSYRRSASAYQRISSSPSTTRIFSITSQHLFFVCSRIKLVRPSDSCLFLENPMRKRAIISQFAPFEHFPHIPPSSLPSHPPSPKSQDWIFVIVIIHCSSLAGMECTYAKLVFEQD